MHDKAITDEIIKELKTVKDTSDVRSEQELVCTQKVEAQRAWKTVLENMRHKGFHLIRRDRQKSGQNR